MQFIKEGNKPQSVVEFLRLYRQQAQIYLRPALANVMESRVAYLQRKKGNKAQQFLVALRYTG
ncbi:hypothetical protein WA1_07920 [Scytonema hofmannii PCC 7110]|uniref:Uncharacterized protein n=1 Tax=Scytonema hofmannii PCC 7110 TaxID=128403 RepID=A0A139WTI4_9CYAN|nr:hypothetical protein [Scytonema hofmannii]KYC35723.1 hypothetical protein WA1_07920 [Scytonema hofmannii PCC 7110]